MGKSCVAAVILLALATLVAAAQQQNAPAGAANQLPDFKGRPIFSVEVVECAMQPKAEGTRGPKARTGVFYYYEEMGPSSYGPLVSSYKLTEGKVDGLGGLGTVESEWFLKRLNALPVVSFDVQKEIDSTVASLRAEAQLNNGSYQPPMALDGCSFRIRYEFNGVSIDYTAWNPGLLIESLAPHSEKLKGLNALIELFAAQYGRRQFQL